MKLDKKKILLIGGAGILAFMLFGKKSSGVELPTGDEQIYNDPSTPSPVIEVNTGTAAPMQNYQSLTQKEALIRFAAGNTALVAAFNKMTVPELNTAYQYVFGFLLQGLKLYRLPGATGIYSDGGWNTVLYDAVDALRKKYLIF